MFSFVFATLGEKSRAVCGVTSVWPSVGGAYQYTGFNALAMHVEVT